MKTRMEFYDNSVSLLRNAQLYSELEDRIYTLLSGKNINFALVVESLGIQRNTAYLRLKKRTFKTPELIEIANKAVEIYQFKL